MGRSTQVVVGGASFVLALSAGIVAQNAEALGILRAPEPPAALSATMDCAPSLSAEVGAAALVHLSLLAPCAPGATALVRHEGMAFALTTDEAGTARADVPALAPSALFAVELDGQDEARVTVPVPEAAAWTRAVLQWAGGPGLEIHAREFGAGYGEAGHVWHGAPGEPEDADAGAGGFVLRLGDPLAAVPRMAEIYSFPTATVDRDGAVALSVELRVDAESCGRPVAAQAMQVAAGASPRTTDLALVAPDCGADGGEPPAEYLVLSNLLPDLTLVPQ